MVADTDNSSKSGTHWWSVLDTEPKTDILFCDSFSVDGLKNLLSRTIKRLLKKILFGTDQMKRTDDKITLLNIKFNLNACKNLLKKDLVP